jgi:serine/threonine protein kinase
LGSGSYKTVYLAFDNDTGREVAWNVISFSHLNRSERKRIDAEIQIIKSLDHPRILKFISVWINREKEEVVFVTERVSGGSLRAYICRLDGPLKLKVIKNWCRQILEGISYLHSQPGPVIHRDLKCDNIFINGNDGKVLIGDLGLSTSLRGQASCATSIVGTPEFMAPELYEEKYGPPVDIYAFGMCLLEMVSRQYPYSECTTPGQIYKKVISSEKPAVLSRVKDPALRHIIEVCLDTNPDNRPTADDLLADPYWQQIEDGLAEIAEEEEPAPGRPTGQGYCEAADTCAKKPPKSGVYHEEAEKRKAAAAALATQTQASQHTQSVTKKDSVMRVESLDRINSSSGTFTPTDLIIEPTASSSLRLPGMAPNVVLGPTDDTLILLSSPKSSRQTEQLEKSDVLTYCRRKGIERVEKVHLILELSEGKYHNVIFDFNASTDHPQIISQELRDAGLVWEGVSNEELVKLTAQAIMDRISELQQVNMSTLSSVGSNNSAMDLLSGETVQTSDQVFGPATGKRPLAPQSSPPSRSSLHSLESGPPVILSKRNSQFTGDTALSNDHTPAETHQYQLLSRETCAHLTAPLLPPSGPGGEYPQPMGHRLSVFDSVMPGLESSPAPIVLGPRTASVGQSLDEMNTSTFSLYNWPSASPPSGDRPVTGEEVKQLQAMLAVTTGDKRHTSFVPGIYCAFTEDCVREFQSQNGLEVTGEVDDRTWELLAEQVEYRKKKEEDRAHKREEAQRKAKQEMERKLQQQKEESARAMDNIMEKTLNSIGLAKGQVGSINVTKPSGLPTVSPGSASPVIPPTSPTTVASLLKGGLA